MNALTLTVDRALAHMQAQLGSLRAMSDILEEQEQAVRSGRGDLVLESVARLRGELVERVRLEEERDLLIRQWADQLGCAPEQVTASRLAEIDPARGPELQSLSDQLHDEALRVQAQQQHTQALMRAELRFVSHLVDALYPGRQSGAYQPGNPAPTTPGPTSVELRG